MYTGAAGCSRIIHVKIYFSCMQITPTDWLTDWLMNQCWRWVYRCWLMLLIDGVVHDSFSLACCGEIWILDTLAVLLLYQCAARTHISSTTLVPLLPPLLRMLRPPASQVSQCAVNFKYFWSVSNRCYYIRSSSCSSYKNDQRN